jgi:hypothetical protein
MNNNGGLVLLMIIVFIFGFAIGLIVSYVQSDIYWKSQAIEHNAAQYHPTTGEFEWVLPADEGKE